MIDDFEEVTSVDDWENAGETPIVLPSGKVVKIRVPDLPALIESGELPQSLLDIAVKVASGERLKPTKELLTKQKTFTDALVRLMVVKPKLTEETVQRVPYLDKELLVEIGTRQRDIDAEYNHIGGLQKSDQWRRFRGFERSDSTLEDV